MSPIFTAYLMLAVAILSEVTGSSFLVKSEGFTKPIPTLITICCFSLSFFLLSHIVKTIPLGIAYAIWSGVGLVLTALISVIVFKHSLDLPAMIGIALIIAGVVVLNVFSKSTGH